MADWKESLKQRQKKQDMYRRHELPFIQNILIDMAIEKDLRDVANDTASLTQKANVISGVKFF